MSKGSQADRDMASLQPSDGGGSSAEASGGPRHREGRSTARDKNGKRIPSIKGASGVPSADRRIDGDGNVIDVRTGGVILPQNGGHY